MTEDSGVSIRPYAEGDMWLLEKTLGDPNQMTYLNGPESKERIRKRHETYLAISANPHKGCMFTILAGSGNAPVGNVGFWESGWKGQTGWEMGWFVLPDFQGRGIATKAARQVIGLLAKRRNHAFVFAFPSVDNRPSNAICRNLGFTLIEDANDEYPPGGGRLLHVNIWRLALPVSG